MGKYSTMLAKALQFKLDGNICTRFNSVSNHQSVVLFLPSGEAILGSRNSNSLRLIRSGDKMEAQSITRALRKYQFILRSAFPFLLSSLSSSSSTTIIFALQSNQNYISACSRNKVAPFPSGREIIVDDGKTPSPFLRQPKQK